MLTSVLHQAQEWHYAAFRDPSGDSVLYSLRESRSSSAVPPNPGLRRGLQLLGTDTLPYQWPWLPNMGVLSSICHQVLGLRWDSRHHCHMRPLDRSADQEFGVLFRTTRPWICLCFLRDSPFHEDRLHAESADRNHVPHRHGHLSRHVSRQYIVLAVELHYVHDNAGNGSVHGLAWRLKDGTGHFRFRSRCCTGMAFRCGNGSAILT